ncbi:hypothetical protein [Flectobacillus longus]|uniref:hypothetical protein n=1 Tax=Flectobacillus longus TaxID=2984207 RepID=UPI0024B7D1EB|nr:hypothetical protein [Flectobacillus longus]MDI9878950.1 hypothetical protein [Flectobacillus longus]
MKTLIYLSFFFMSLSETIAQNFIGNWQGQVQGNGGALQAEMSITNAGNKQIVGKLHLYSGATLESYELKCNVNPNNASGTLSYKDGTVFGLEMIWQNNTIQQQISYNNQVILQGSFSKKTEATKPADTSTKPDGLFRDPNLVGIWTHHENYSSNGGFYGGSSTSIVLHADGTIDDGGSSTHVSGPNSSGNSSGGENSVIAQIKAVGARWFTKGNILYWRITINGKVTDVPNSKYYIEKGALLLTDYNTGKKMLYYKK